VNPTGVVIQVWSAAQAMAVGADDPG
jgi:hypothetical protein